MDQRGCCHIVIEFTQAGDRDCTGVFDVRRHRHKRFQVPAVLIRNRQSGTPAPLFESELQRPIFLHYHAIAHHRGMILGKIHQHAVGINHAAQINARLRGAGVARGQTNSSERQHDEKSQRSQGSWDVFHGIAFRKLN